MPGKKRTRREMTEEAEEEAKAVAGATAEGGNGEGEEAEESSFAGAMGKIMSRALGDKNPVLAKRRTAMMKQRELEKSEQRKAKESLREKRERRKRHMVSPAQSDRSYEKQLRRIATKGVVALFNAVRKHQKESEEKERGPGAKGRKVLSVESSGSKLPSERRQAHFLDLLKASTGIAPMPERTAVEAVGEPGAGPKRWAALQDDFMTRGGAGEEVEEEEGEDGEKWGVGANAVWEMEEEDDLEEEEGF